MVSFPLPDLGTPVVGLARHRPRAWAGDVGPAWGAADDAVRDVRYLDVLPLPGGGYRIWYEARLPDESHELRTELIEAS
ncbi:MAG: hypothetical protein ACT4OQ_03220 [Chloroflexota bacterium]